jgi:autotransporter-associated beta strand protein
MIRWQLSVRSILFVMFALIASGAAEASTYQWAGSAGGPWNVPGNWSVIEGPAGVGYPNLPGDVAVIYEGLMSSTTVTIPDGVTIAIGKLKIMRYLGGVRIRSGGTGLLVFDNLGEDAVIETDVLERALILEAPIQLASDLIVQMSCEFSGIGEVGGDRTVTITNGVVTFVPANTYTADVLVRADGTLTFASRTSSSAHTIDKLTVEGGSVFVNITSTSLTVQQAVTMAGGEITIGSSGGGNVLHVNGAFNATSTAAGPATIRRVGGVPSPVALGPGNHDFTIADGPHAIDFLIDGADIVESAAGDGLTKRGPGVMRIGGGSYTGATAVLAGTLDVNGNLSTSPTTVGATATLTGTGTVGPVTVNANGTLAPGLPNGAMKSGAVAFTPGAHFSIGVNGALSPAGPGYNRLVVTGTVDLNGASLDVTGDTALPKGAIFTIIENDGTDPVVGTFAGAPEGMGIVVPTFSYPLFRISYQGGDGNDVVLISELHVEYFLSEGATGSFFDEDLLIANPNAEDAQIALRFVGAPVYRELTVPARSRLTLSLDQIPGLENASASVEVFSHDRWPLAVERTMFWDATRYGGHTANAVTRAEQFWLFGEGAQSTFFDTYLLLGNAFPSSTDAKVTFLRENEPPFVTTVRVPGRERVTVHAGTYPELAGRAFGMKVESDVPIIAERAMYFASSPTRLWTGGHGNAGNPAPSTHWFHAEGASGTFFSTFILVSNPQTTPANVTLRFLLQDGAPIELTRTIAPLGRLTVNPAAEGELRLQNASFSTVVTSNVPVVSERAMYWPTDVPFGEGHASSGVLNPALSWALAEGRVGGANAFTTYILLANPNAQAADVTVMFLRESGTPVVKTYNVPGNTRFNVDVGGMVSELQNESFGASVTVTNDVPIAVERSMYWNVNGIFWQGGTNAVGSVIP